MVGHYFYEKTFSYGGSKAAEEEMTLQMTSGVVHNVHIDFPVGCMYLCKVKIMRGTFQVFPRNIGQYYAFEGWTLPIHDYWQLRPLERELTLVGYNEDASHDHTIRISLQVSDPEDYWAEQRLNEKLERSITLLERIIGVEQFAQLVGETEAEDETSEETTENGENEQSEV